MSVLIRMEMPSNCAECPLNHDAECAVKNLMVIDDCYVRRAPWCPLVPVPPHGDLIERDALTISTAVPLDGKPYQYVHFLNIKGAPTIIPAEEVEHGTLYS